MPHQYAVYRRWYFVRRLVAERASCVVKTTDRTGTVIRHARVSNLRIDKHACVIVLGLLVHKKKLYVVPILVVVHMDGAVSASKLSQIVDDEQ